MTHEKPSRREYHRLCELLQQNDFSAARAKWLLDAFSGTARP